MAQADLHRHRAKEKNRQLKVGSAVDLGILELSRALVLGVFRSSLQVRVTLVENLSMST